MNLEDLKQLAQNANVQAFLRVIRARESGQGDNAYRMVNGGGIFSEFSAHPYAGLTTTHGGRAAGAYQFLPTTWGELVAACPGGDFSPEWQDLRCIQLIVQRGAMPMVLAGKIEEAMIKLRPTWTSLPGASESKIGWTVNLALAVYREYGGVTATDQMAADLEPTKGKQMPIAALIATFGPLIADLIPQVAKLFSSGSEVATRNVAAGEAVLNAVTKAAGAVNIQEALEKIQADKALQASVQQAVVTDPVIMGLLEVGGGIAAARTAAADPGQIAFYKNPAFIMSLVLIPLIYMVVYAVLFDAAAGWSDEMRSVVVTAIVTGLVSSITGFFLGSSLGSQKKTEIMKG